MALLKVIRSLFYISVALLSVIYTFYTVIELMKFLSYTDLDKYSSQKEDNGTFITWSLLVNMSLLSVFILQHSLMTLPSVTQFFIYLKLAVLQRSIYVFCTSLALKFVIDNWQIIPTGTLWALKSNSSIIWWSFFIPHALAWGIIYIGTICMDINELLGLKQVYYNLRNLPDPLSFKSLELRRLYSHMRHPSFIGFLILLWITPVMSLDRLLLATILSSYMYLSWNTDPVDYRYQEIQYLTKFHELDYVK